MESISYKLLFPWLPHCSVISLVALSSNQRFNIRLAPSTLPKRPQKHLQFNSFGDGNCKDTKYTLTPPKALSQKHLLYEKPILV